MNKQDALAFFESINRLPIGLERASGVTLSNKIRHRIVGVHTASVDTIYIDVTDTDTCPIVTGIQRVARKVIECFGKDGVKYELIRYDFDLKGFVVLEGEEKESFLSRMRQSNGVSKRTWRSVLNDIFYKLARSVGRLMSSLLNSEFGFLAEIRQGIESSKPGLVRKIRSRKKRQYSLKPLRPVENMKILLPELIYEKGRTEQYLSLKSNFKAEVTAVLYDLIPLYHPEFVEVSREYLDYLRVVRNCRHTVAISEYSADQLKSYLTGWQREQDAAVPVSQALYLPFAKQENLPVKEKMEIPTFLFVSTIEPRKNHLRLAQAAEMLNKLGYKFQVICVGKIGWIEEEAWEKIDEIRNSGVPIKFMHDVGDAELKSLLGRSSCAIYPSVVEGFGLPIIEADGFNLPVIASNNSAMRDVCRHFVKCYYLVEPEEVESIAAGMKEFLDFGTAKFTVNSKFGAIPSSWEEYSRLLHKIVIS